MLEENKTGENKKRVMQAGFVLLCVLSAYFAVGIISKLKQVSMLGESSTPATISFSGHGEVMAVPDIANVYFTISKDATTVKDAQAAVSVVEKSALDLLKGKGVEDKDIQTADASFTPKYSYAQVLCPQTGGTPVSYDCVNRNQTIIGYTASESITVKIRNTDNAGAIIQSLGTVGVSNLSGPNFTIDNQDALQLQARKKAIDDAKAKAQALAKDLGVSLGKISSFSDSNGGYYPMYAKDAVMSAGSPAAPAPAQLPKGENTISSDVNIIYEIR